MATTTQHEREVGTVLYAEDDKLGPLGTKRSVTENGAELRHALIAEFRAAADAARDAAAAVDYSATAAVHEYRKALRRARAVLLLVADALPSSERKAVRRALRDARRSLGTARDHAVAPDTVNLLDLEHAEQATIDKIMTTAREAIPPLAEIKQLLAEGAARTAAQVEALEAALPQELGWRMVVRSVGDVYERACTARKKARKSKRTFHTWRRRSKELIYQLEVIAGYTGDHVNSLRKEIEHATDEQGPVVDLIMLRDFARTHSAGIAPEALDAVVDVIDAEISARARAARRAGRDAFARKPRRFVRRLAKAARKDAAPPAPSAEHDIGD